MLKWTAKKIEGERKLLAREALIGENVYKQHTTFMGICGH